MSLELQAVVVVRLFLAAFLSMIIGIDRESHGPAGLRTHMLVGLGSCLFTSLSLFAFPDSDESRVASQIVVGIGFLGAGTIIRSDRHARHLTTAASIWATASVGMAVGVGAWFLAIGGTLIIWVVLVVVRWFSKREKVVNPVATTDESSESE
jgi:putative Mg2+ transporter-C (MgtC) family protein